MSGLRSQAAPLPEPSALQACAAAYAAGDVSLGDRLFAAAHDEVMPLVRAVVCSRLDDEDQQHEAISRTVTGIWQALRAGVEPGVRRRANFAAIDVYRRNVSHDDHHESLERDVDRTIAAPEHDPDSTRTLDLVASYSPDIWHDIAELATAGWSLAEIAIKLGVAKSSVRRIAMEMRNDYQIRKALEP